MDNIKTNSNHDCAFEVWMPDDQFVCIRKPCDIPDYPDGDPGYDSTFMNNELQAISTLGTYGYPWYFGGFYLFRLWRRSSQHYSLAKRAFKAGKMKRSLAVQTRIN